MSLTSLSAPCPPRPAVVGPTTTGRFALALNLAERIHSDEPATRAKIINADTSLLYCGTDIDTAKPSPVERARAPHHRIDVLAVRNRASVAAFQCSTHGDIDAVGSRGRLPIIAEGSDLHVRALTDDLDFPGTDPVVRSRPSGRAKRERAVILHAEPARLDPVAAECVEASNTRRIAWALKAIEIIGRSFSASLPHYEDVAPTVHIALRCERRLLDKHTNKRVRIMFGDGLIEEVEALTDQGTLEGGTAPRATDYAQTLAVIDGTIGVPEAVNSTALATHQLASRRIKWFRRDPRLYWIDVALAEAGQCTDSECSRFTRQAWELVCARRGVAQARGHAVLDRLSQS